ncbi:MAG: hypothetical protein U5J62_07055 [Desulfurivibrio sp.]|nr:hypothetical protein [Desulfurivibrio sp.]
MLIIAARAKTDDYRDKKGLFLMMVVDSCGRPEWFTEKKPAKAPEGVAQRRDPVGLKFQSGLLVCF